MLDTEKIRLLRLQKKLTQAQMGTLVGISQNHYSQIETGRFQGSLETLIAIANTLDVTVNDLILLNPPIPSPGTTRRKRGERRRAAAMAANG